jgi:hypothetical protein
MMAWATLRHGVEVSKGTGIAVCLAIALFLVLSLLAVMYMNSRYYGPGYRARDVARRVGNWFRLVGSHIDRIPMYPFGGHIKLGGKVYAVRQGRVSINGGWTQWDTLPTGMASSIAESAFRPLEDYLPRRDPHPEFEPGGVNPSPLNAGASVRMAELSPEQRASASRHWGSMMTAPLPTSPLNAGMRTVRVMCVWGLQLERPQWVVQSSGRPPVEHRFLTRVEALSHIRATYGSTYMALVEDRLGNDLGATMTFTVTDSEPPSLNAGAAAREPAGQPAGPPADPPVDPASTDSVARQAFAGATKALEDELEIPDDEP